MNSQAKTAIFVTLTIFGVMLFLIKFGQPRKVEKDMTDTQTNVQDDVVQDTKELEMEVLVEGEGTPAKEGDTVAVYYKGTFEDGTEFDSSDAHPPKTPFEFTLGEGMVIRGWDLGVEGMKPGETRKLVIPSDLAYGPNDYNGIPGGSTLIFEVELLEVK
jgi:FKBP-type peptidyl-prolyl cis-trans isomerase